MEKKKKKLAGSFVAKVIAFLLLAVSAFAAVFSGLYTIAFVGDGYYTDDPAEIFFESAHNLLYQETIVVKELLAQGNLNLAEMICDERNFDIALIPSVEVGWGSLPDEQESVIWTTYDGSYETVQTLDLHLQFPEESSERNLSINSHRIVAGKDYIFRVYVNMDFPKADELSEIYNECVYMQHLKYSVLWVLSISVLVVLISFLFLMCSAGHRNDAEGIQPSVFSGIPLDLHTAACGAVAVLLLVILLDSTYYLSMNIVEIAAFSLLSTGLVIWCTFYLRELATRMKLGNWWKNTVVYHVLRFIKKILLLFWKGMCAMFRGFPLILNTLIAFFGICILEFIGICMFVRRGLGEIVVLWLTEKTILLPIVVYTAVMCKRLLVGSRALAEGKQEISVDTSHMFGDFKECGENLNSIGQGISKAVAERMKSEHLKTELITNVSHDLKTPLTSIINYANLIAEESSENEKITEYSEVLVRQSDRLKKLLEDLVEASKATTGNIEVDLRPCEISVILSQAVGEYQQRMEEKQLELIVVQPEEAVNIMADGKHLWRVFDNLLNNICKYAREDSRVYLSVEKKGKSIDIIFRNMSKYALNISAEELQERFVRGDRSRHMEGNGLGLSIAKSLTELQNGQMEIVTDGDLFKVILSFTEI